MRVFRSAFVLAVALAVGAGSVRASEVASPSGPYSWSGFDFGVQGGYGGSIERDNLGLAEFEPPTQFFPTNVDVGGAAAHRAIGGFHLDYDQQFGSLVFGMRGEVDWTGLSGATSSDTNFNLNGGANCDLGCMEYRASSTFADSRQAFLLGRSGYAFGKVLVFAEGGLALSNESLSVQVIQSIQPGSPKGPTLTGVWGGASEHDLVGAAVGVGAEYALTDNWRLGADWRFAEFAPASASADLLYNRISFNHPVAYRAGFFENLGLLDASYHF